MPVGARRQRGVAIITALLIVTIAVTVSITISTRLQLDVRRTSNLITTEQANFYLLAAEEWSQRILREDKKDSKTDDLSEAWAIELPPLPVTGGSIQGKLTDLNSCLNVNALFVSNLTAAPEENTGSAAPSTVNLTVKTRLEQLFRNLAIDSNLVQSITDWIDENLETSNPGGAEDGYYLNLDKPYHTANTQLQSISELRLIKGFEDAEVYGKVKDYLCPFVPIDDKLGINVNTASAEVLKSLSTKITDKLADSIIEKREQEPFQEVNDFASFTKLESIINGNALLSTSSNYFLLRSQAKIGQANKVMYSVIYRDDGGKTQVISRVYRTL